MMNSADSAGNFHSRPFLFSPLRSSATRRFSSPPSSPPASKQSALLPPLSPISFNTITTGVDILNKIYWSLQWGVQDAKILKAHPITNSRTFNTAISSFNADHEPGRDLTEKEWTTIVNPQQKVWTATCVFDWALLDNDASDAVDDFPHGGPIVFDGKSTVRDVLTAIAHLKHPYGWFEGIEQVSSGKWILKFGP